MVDSMIKSWFAPLLVSLVVPVLSQNVYAFEDSAKTEEVSQAKTEWSLPAVEGGKVELSLGSPCQTTVLCFLGTECPLARLYGPRLQRLAEEFEGKVRFIGISSNLQDDLEELKKYIETTGIQFEFGKDYENQLADALEAERTPEVIMLDASGKIQYRGRIDDQYLPGIVKPAPTQDDLREALLQLTSGKEVTVASTKPVGCLMGKMLPGEVTTDKTFCHDVAPILNQHCVECHRSGEIGPFDLTNYDEIVGWGSMMLEVVNDGRMPPWHANPEFSKFANERRMTDNEKATLKEWVEGGMPYGDSKDLPKQQTYVSGWQFDRKPDVVFDMHRKAFEVPAEGVVDYQYYVVDPGFEEDTWVNGAEIIPGNRAVVHHCIVFVRPPDGEDFKGLGWVAGYVPGQRSVQLPPGYARKVPAFSKFIFQMHYTPNGDDQKDLTKLGLLLIDEEEVTHEISTLLAINSDFEIPPGESDFSLNARLKKLPQHGELIAIIPHMHYRGKSMRVFARSNSEKEVLLDVPRYDFNWQHVYELAEARPLGSIDSLSFEAKFDNSSENPFNPDPEAYVTWGEQSSEEMAIAFFEVATPRVVSETQQKVVEKPKAKPVVDEQKQQKVEQFVTQYFERFDRNADGKVVKDELPISMRRFGFNHFDKNRDGMIIPEEVRELASRSREL